MTIWESLPTEHILANLEAQAMAFDKHRHNFTDTALNRAILDRSRLASALTTLLTAIQLEDHRPSIRPVQAEAAAVAALESLEQDTEPAIAPV